MDERKNNPSDVNNVDNKNSTMAHTDTVDADKAVVADVVDVGAERKKQIRKKILQYIAFIVINAAVILVLIAFEDKNGDTASGREALYLFGKNWAYTLLSFLMFFLIIGGDTVVFSSLIGKIGIKKNFSVSLRVSIYGRYYDRLTPWSIGGEPFQMAFLMKQGGLSGPDSCAVTMSRHIIRFFTTAIAVIIILIASRITTNIWVMTAAIVSVLFGLIIPSFMIICCVKPELGHRIGSGVIKLLYKCKIVKNYDKEMAKMQDTVNNFLKGIEYLSANKQMIVIIGLMSLLELFATNSIPYFVMRSIGITGVNYWHILVLCIFVTYASSFAPTPGGAGIAELSFYAIFASAIHDGLLFWAVLCWRLAIFYVPVFLGFVLQTVESTILLIKRIKG